MGAANGPMHIKNNDDVLCTAWIDAYTATCSAVAQVAIGDSVRVTGDSTESASIFADYSGFAGHIISDNLTA